MTGPGGPTAVVLPAASDEAREQKVSWRLSGHARRLLTLALAGLVIAALTGRPEFAQSSLNDLMALGLPIWARWIRVRGATKDAPGAIGEPVIVGGAEIRQGDAVVLDVDGVAVVESERVQPVLEAARERAEKERVKRSKLEGGALSYDLDGLRERVEVGR